MIWALVCDNMYRYGRHFGSFYCHPTIVETVFDCLGQHGELCWDTTWSNSSTDVSLSTQNGKIKCKYFFFISHVGLPQLKSTWVLRGVSCWLRNHLPCQYTATERQNITDRTHTWQQCSVTMSEDISTTKYGFIQSQIDFTAKHRKQTRWYNTSTLAGE